MLITRESKLKIQDCNSSKKQYLDKLFEDYAIDLQFYIDKMISGQLPFNKFLSSKEIPSNILKHSQWKQIIYKQASQIYRSNLQIVKKGIYKKYKKIYSTAIKANKFQKFTSKRFRQLDINYAKRIKKIDIKNTTINIDSRLLSSTTNNKHFNEFIGIKLPYFHQNKKRAIQINLPLQYHKHYRKFKSWKRKNTIKLTKDKNNMFVSFAFEKDIQKKTQNKAIGVDIGYKKIFSTSNEKYCGKDFFSNFVQKQSLKQQGSKNHSKLLVHKNNQLRRLINQFFNNVQVDYLIIQQLKNIKRNKKTKYNNLTYWTPSLIIKKLQSISQDRGINLLKVSAAYTSQKCSNCCTINKDNRNGQTYVCSTCGLQIDADYNASINILQRGVNYYAKYNKKIIPLTKEN